MTTMKKTLSILAATAIACAIGASAMAQTAGPVGRFDEGYLDQHPEVARQLEANPALIDNRQYVEQHPGLDEYLENHPQVREQMREHPERFMQAEQRRDQWEQQAHPLRSTDHYLDRHPEVDKQLSAHPGLVDDPKYMAAHQGLGEFFARHPVARSEWTKHPHRYMNNEERNGQNH